MIGFALREGWRSFRTLGLGGLLTLVSLTITLALGALTAEGVLMLQRWQRSALERFEIEAFLRPDIAVARAEAALDAAGRIPHVAGVRFVTRDDAAERFREQFGGDILDLLGYNPLPPSLIVTLSGKLTPGELWRLVAKALEEIDGVEDVVYQGELLGEVEKLFDRAGRTLLLLIGGVLGLSLLFTGLTVAAAIRARGEFIQILLLCGGSRMMARGPFIALGGYYGAVAGVAGGLLATLTLWVATLGWAEDAGLPLGWTPFLVAAGIVIGGTTAGWVAGRKIRTV